MLIRFLQILQGGKREGSPREKGKREEQLTLLLSPFLTRQPDHAYARTNKAKQFPGWFAPPNLLFSLISDVFLKSQSGWLLVWPPHKASGSHPARTRAWTEEPEKQFIFHIWFQAHPSPSTSGFPAPGGSARGQLNSEGALFYSCLLLP